MNTYLYDGSFDGLLTVFFYAYKDPDVYAISRQDAYQPDLLSQPNRIQTETDKAIRIYQSVQQKLSQATLRNLYLLYLSELPHCDWFALDYLRLCYAKGAIINQAKQHPVIRQVEDYCYKVRMELEHMKGFLRFQQIAPLVFYASFSPDHNQLPLLQPHLQKRFSDQRMIVHDEKRNQALIYDLKQSTIISFTHEDATQLLQNKNDTTIELFRQYFQAINITERANPRLQAQYMPHRYRKYMGETQASSEEQ